MGTAALSLMTQVLFERGLGVEGFAQWALVNSLVVVFITVACFGSSNLVMSEYFEGHLTSPAGRIALARFFLTTGLIALLGFVAAYGWAPLPGARTPRDVALGALILVAQIPIVLVYPMFQIHDRARMVAFWHFMQNLGRSLVAATSLIVAMTYTTAMAGWLAVSLVLCAWVLLDRGARRFPAAPLIPSPRQERTSEIPQTVAARGLRFGFAEALDALDLKVALPIAALFLTAKETAATSLGLVFLFAVHFFPYVLVTRYLLPAVHSSGRQETNSVLTTVDRWLVLGVIASGAVAVLFALFGANLVAILARGDYNDQRHMFVAAGIAMVPLSVSILGSATFMTIDRQRDLLAWRVRATLVFLLTLVLTAPWMGSAAAFIAIAAGRTYLGAKFVLVAAREREFTIARKRRVRAGG